MEEKILAKGKFSKFNFISGIFLAFSVFGVLGLFSSFQNGNLVDTTSFVIGIVYFFVGIGGAALFYHLLNKCEITVTDKRVYGKAAFGKRVDLPFDMISSVDMCAFKGVGVATSSGRIKFLFCINKEDVFSSISNVLLERQDKKRTQTEKPIIQEIKQSEADELKKYKDLLDSGVITQEEFDAKKKQLLGL